MGKYVESNAGVLMTSETTGIVRAILLMPENITKLFGVGEKRRFKDFVRVFGCDIEVGEQNMPASDEKMVIMVGSVKNVCISLNHLMLATKDYEVETAYVPFQSGMLTEDEVKIKEEIIDDSEKDENCV